jgi:hypothetical protein
MVKDIRHLVSTLLFKLLVDIFQRFFIKLHRSKVKNAGPLIAKDTLTHNVPTDNFTAMLLRIKPKEVPCEKNAVFIDIV